MAAATGRTDDGHLINDNDQYYGSSIINDQSQQSADRQFEANWFSPSLTSTQIVSFDLINTEDDTHDDFLLTHETETIFRDISLEDIPCPADSSSTLTYSVCTMVSETPPPQGKSLDWDITNPTNYLFNNTRWCRAESFTSTPNQTMKAPSKRQYTQKANKKSSQMKKVKLEGYSCKLNGAVYHVVKRDFDVLEAIEKAMKCIQQTIHQHDMCSVRHLSLQLNQIETVMGILDDEQLGLEMPLEVWNEMMEHTKKIFRNTQNEVDAVRRRRFELDTFTDELTHSFSQSFSISSSNQGRPKKQHTSANMRKNQAKIPAKSINFVSKTLKAGKPDSVGQSENVQVTQIPNTHEAGVLLQTSPSQRNGLLATDNIQISSDLLSSAPCRDVVPASASPPRYSRGTLAIEENDSNRHGSDYIEALPEVTISTAVSPVVNNCLLQIGKEIACNNNRAIDLREESFIVGEPYSASQSSFLGSNNRTPEIVKMGFHLRPFVLKGVLCPGKNNMKLTINSRIYIGSLAADGTIEMNGFNFPTIGNWIKSVEGKRFTKLSRFVQKTLDLQYNGKYLAKVLEVDEQSRSSDPREIEEIPFTDDIAPLSLSHSPRAENNLVQKPIHHPAIQKPTPYLTEAGSNLMHKSATIPTTGSNFEQDLQLVPEEMTRHVKTIFLHAQDEYFTVCKCAEQFWCGVQPFPEHILDEVDSWN